MRLRNAIAGVVVTAAVFGGGTYALAQDQGGADVGAETPTEDGAVEAAPGEESSCDAEGPRHGRHRGGPFADEMAEALGVTTEQLAEARAAAHEALRDEFEPLERPDNWRELSDDEREALRAEHEAQHEARQDRADELMAEQFGISVEEIRAARRSVAEQKVDEAVAQGRLTEEEAAAAREAIASGERPDLGRGDGFGRPGGGGPHGWGGPGRGHGGPPVGEMPEQAE